MELSEKKCVPCEGGVFPLARQESEPLLRQINGWQLSEDALSISKTFAFKDFAQSLAFADKIGEIAEQEGHHPDLHVSWGSLKVDLTTHAIGGLSENDFILAAKIDKISQ